MAKSGLMVSARTAPNGRNESHGDLHLAHQRQNLAFTAIDRQPRVHPALRASFHQHTAMKPGLFELFNRFTGASAGLAEHIYRNPLYATLSSKSGRAKVVEWNELCAGNMSGGKLARSANIDQLRWVALRQQALKFERVNGCFGLQSIHNHGMNI